MPHTSDKDGLLEGGTLVGLSPEDEGIADTQPDVIEDEYADTLADPLALKHEGSENETQHVDTMEFEEPDVESIFELEFPEVKETTEAVFKKCFGRLNDFMPALMYFQGEHRAGDRLITASYNDFHIPGEEESLLLINYLEILEDKKKVLSQYLADHGQGVLTERMMFAGFSKAEEESNLDRRGVTGTDKDVRLKVGKISNNKLTANIKKIKLRLQVNISVIDERIKKLLEGPLFSNAYYGQTVIYDLVKMTRSKVERDKKGKEYIAKDESMMGVVVGNILHELAMLDPRLNMAERLLKDEVYLDEAALTHMDMYLKIIHGNEYLTAEQTSEFIQHFERIVRIQRTLDNRNDDLHRWLNTLESVSRQRKKGLRDDETIIPPQHLSYEHKLVYDTYNEKLDEVLNTYLYHFYDLEQYTSILADIIVTVPEINKKYGVVGTAEGTDTLIRMPLFDDAGKLNTAVFDADARQRYILPFFNKLLALVRQRDQPGFLSGAIEEALSKYKKHCDEIICAEYARTLLGLMESSGDRVDVLRMIENRSRVLIQPEGKVVFDSLFHFNATITDDAQCLERFHEYLSDLQEKMSDGNKAKKEEDMTRNFEDVYRLALKNISSHHWMEDPYGFHFRKYHQFADSRLRKIKEIIIPMLVRKLFFSAEDMYSRYRRVRLREDVVLEDINFEIWLDHFFAVYDNQNAAKKFNSKDYRFFDRIKVEELAIQNPTAWVKEMVTQLFLMHSERRFNEIFTTRQTDDFHEFLEMTFDRLNEILKTASEKRRRKSDFNIRLQQRIAEQKDTAEAIALKTLLDSESEQAFEQEVKDSMQRCIVENEEGRQTDFRAGDEIKQSIEASVEEEEEESGVFKKFFGGLFGGR